MISFLFSPWVLAPLGFAICLILAHYSNGADRR